MAFLSSMNIVASGLTAQQLRLDVVAETDDAWVREYFHGPRGRAALQAKQHAGA